MTVREFIDRLQQYDSALLVALADWNEEWQAPSTTWAEKMCVTYTRTLEHPTPQRVLVIGEDGPHH